MEKEPRRTMSEEERLFFKVYGIPLSWAKQMSRFDNDLGKHWKGILDFLTHKDDQQEHIIYVRPKTKQSKR